MSEPQSDFPTLPHGIPPADAVTIVSAEAGLPITEGPGSVIGRYKLLQQIGEGGFGVVYMAEQTAPVTRRVALKIIKLGMDTKQVIARFEAERQALAMMDHPNIAKVLDAGATDSGRPYFVMELVKGIPVTEYCDKNHLVPHARLELFISVCQAIQHAHQKGIIHRDIKPSNVLVTLHDGKPIPMVIDFGIAKATNQKLTEKTLFTNFASMIGTPAYMSPEQAEMSQLDIDTRSDIYSLGVLLYELLTGTTPFPEKRLRSVGYGEMQRIIAEEEPQRPSTRLSTMEDAQRTSVAKNRNAEAATLKTLFRGDLDWIVMKSLEKDRTRRYETANGLAIDIKRHLSNEPVTARPPSTLYVLQKMASRHKVVVAAAAAVATALCGGVLVSSWQAARARTAAKLAETESHRARAAERLALGSLYAADLSLAYRAFSDNNLGEAIRILDQHRPAAGEPDLRGWEWRYLWSACRSDELYNFATLSGGLGGVAVSPDGKLLALAGRHSFGEAGVTLWEIASRRLIATIGGPDSSGSVAFSPDGTRIAFGTAYHGLRLWDIAAAKEIAHFPGQERLWSMEVAFSPDGQSLAYRRDPGGIAVVSLTNDQSNILLSTEPNNRQNPLVFSKDGTTLISGSFYRPLQIWSLHTGQRVGSFSSESAGSTALAASPDGRTVATGGRNIQIYDIVESSHVVLLTNHGKGVSALAFSPDGKTLASAGGDHLIKLWDTARWVEITTFRGSLSDIRGLVYSPDGKFLFSASTDGTAKVWGVSTKRREFPILEPSEDTAQFWNFGRGYSLPLLPISWHTNDTFTVWEPEGLHPLGRYRSPPGIDTNVAALDITPGHDRLLLAYKTGEIGLWDIRSEREIARLPWNPIKVAAGRVSPDGALVCFAAANELILCDLDPLHERVRLSKSAANPNVICFSKDNRWLAIGNEGSDQSLEAFDLTSNRRLGTWKAHRGDVRTIAFVPGTNLLVSASFDGTVRLWDIERQKELRQFGRAANRYDSMAISPDGTRVAAASSGFVRIWDLETGQEVALLNGLPDRFVYHLEFLRDGKTLMTCTPEVRLWRAPSWKEIEVTEAKGNAQSRDRK